MQTLLIFYSDCVVHVVEPAPVVWAVVSAVCVVDHAADVLQSVVSELKVGTVQRISPPEKATGERDLLDSAPVSVAAETSQVSRPMKSSFFN